MINRWKIKNPIKKADSSISDDEAEYLADCLFEEIEFDFSPESTFVLMAACMSIGLLIGTLKH